MKQGFPNILLTNVASWTNKGDAAILLVALSVLKKQFPKSKISISCLDVNSVNFLKIKCYRGIRDIVFKEDENKYKKLVKSLIFLFKISLFQLFLIFGFKSYFLFSNELQNKIKSYEKFDLIIANGGGYLYSKNNIDFILTLISAYDFFIAKLFNKPYILLNQSVGPFKNKIHFFVIKSKLSNAKLVVCRDKSSFDLLNKNNLKNIVLRSDLAFDLVPKKVSLNNFDYTKINIGINLVNFLEENKQKKYEDIFFKFLRYLLSDNRISIYLIPQSSSYKYGQNDNYVSIRLKKRTNKNYFNRINIVQTDLKPSELKYVISKMDFFISSRMHSSIFSISSFVKTIGIAYSNKTKDLFSRLNISDYLIDIENLNFLELCSKFNNLKKDKSYIKNLKRNIVRIKDNKVNLRKFI